MKGHNELRFCQEEMIKALDTYLREHIFKNWQGSVVSVKEDKSIFNCAFNIELTDSRPSFTKEELEE